jgi:hypothetical protein
MSIKQFIQKENTHALNNFEKKKTKQICQIPKKKSRSRAR